MPVRIRSKPMDKVLDQSLVRSPSLTRSHEATGSGERLPDIEATDSFRAVVKKLSVFMTAHIVLPSTFEQLRTTSVGEPLRAIVQHLSAGCTHPAIVNALLALKWHYGNAQRDKGLMEARANSCEIVAWRFLGHLSEREAVEFCLYEIPPAPPSHGPALTDEEAGGDARSTDPDETSPLLSQAWAQVKDTVAGDGAEHAGPSSKRSQLLQSISRLTMSMTADSDDEHGHEHDEDPTAPFVNLNALEIAAIADAKRFLSQNLVQKIVTGIWNGDIIFWDRLSVHTTKKPRFYNPKTADPFSRLRVPKYLKCFELVFFASFLFLYYVVLINRVEKHISALEVLLYLWIAAFSYDELSEWIDAGSTFYAADVWNVFDLIMISIGITFGVLRIVGLAYSDPRLTDLAYDILALEALFMVPRVSSILSLSPYWGTLIPCFKEMGKDFVKFMVLVLIVYLGFLTTFTLIGRDHFGRVHMMLILTKIFFGNSGTGFDVMEKVDPFFGPPLMIIFIMLSSILLMGSLTGMLSNSFSRVITHAREEYLYVYSVYVLEASTSNRLTHFYPPFNLLALFIFRPLRLFLSSHTRFRAARIVLLKATHLPIVAVIQIYEFLTGRLQKGSDITGFHGPNGAGILRRGPSTAAGGSVSSRPHTGRPSAPGPPLSSSSSSAAPSSHPRSDSAAETDDLGELPDSTEARLTQLTAKIDRLTELVLRMQTTDAAQRRL